jgi:hypothetical protein
VRTTRKIWGFHGGDYEKCRLLEYRNPVRTAQETHYVSATESSRLMLCKICGFHGGDYEECRLLECSTVWLVRTGVSEERIAFIIMVTRFTELCLFLRSVLQLLDTANVRSSVILGCAMISPNVGSYNSHTPLYPRRRHSSRTIRFCTSQKVPSSRRQGDIYTLAMTMPQQVCSVIYPCDHILLISKQVIGRREWGNNILSSLYMYLTAKLLLLIPYPHD